MSLEQLYNKTIIVNYKNFEIADDDNDAKSQTEYRKQLLDVFNISIDQFNLLTTKIDKLYVTLSILNYWRHEQLTMFNDILTSMAAQLLSEDKSMGFSMLFSYDYFDMINIFINDYLYNKTVNMEILRKLKNKICN